MPHAHVSRTCFNAGEGHIIPQMGLNLPQPLGCDGANELELGQLVFEVGVL